MATATLEKDFLELEKQYWKALTDGDVATAVQLTDFPCIITGPQGVGRVDEQAFTAMMKESPYRLNRAELNDVQVRLLQDDVAVVAYKVHEEYTVEGKPVAFEAADSSTWIRRNGRWACAVHAEAIVGDPFGRDRQASA